MHGVSSSRRAFPERGVISMNKYFALAAWLAACALLPAAASGGQTPAQFKQYATRAVDASRITHRNFIGGINNRLTVVHEMAFPDSGNPEGIWNTATYEPVDRYWLGGIASGARQTGIDGYNFDAYGINTGYDWSCGDLTIGVAMAVTTGEIINSDFDTKNKVDALNLALYASLDPLEGLFYDVNATYGMSWNRSLSMEVAEGRGSREGRFGATSYGLGGNIGRSFDLALAKITPTIGLQWTRYTQDAYDETAYIVAPNRFEEGRNDLVEFPLAVRVGTSWQLGGGTILSPELRAAYVFRAGDRKSTIVMSGEEFGGADDGKSSMRLGAGLKANFSPAFDAFFDYSLELKSGYRSTNFNTGLGVSF
jgi:outer membrane autotransporter protein